MVYMIDILYHMHVNELDDQRYIQSRGLPSLQRGRDMSRPGTQAAGSSCLRWKLNHWKWRLSDILIDERCGQVNVYMWAEYIYTYIYIHVFKNFSLLNGRDVKSNLLDDIYM